MYKQFDAWLHAIPVNDPIERRQAAVFQIMLIIWMILALGWDVVAARAFVPLLMADLTGAPPIFRILILLSILAAILLFLCPFSAQVLLRRGKFRLSVMVASLGFLGAHCIATYTGGVTNSAVLVVFQIPIAMAGLLGSRRLLATVSGLSILIVLVVTYLESFSPPLAGYFGVTTGAPGSSPLDGQPVMMMISFFIGVTVLLTVLLDRFGGALREALAQSMAREAELSSLRASLEATVVSRTSQLQAALEETQARSEAQAKLLQENEEQRMIIRDLSVPVIPIKSDTLVLPLIGALDSRRLSELQEQSVQAISRTSARVLVLDITGVPIIDSQVAQSLLSIVRMAALLGAKAILVGIRPEVAQTIVGLGIDLRDMDTFTDLQSALVRL